MNSLFKNQIFVNRIFHNINLSSRDCSTCFSVPFFKGANASRFPTIAEWGPAGFGLGSGFLIFFSFLDLSIADAGSLLGASPAKLWINRG